MKRNAAFELFVLDAFGIDCSTMRFGMEGTYIKARYYDTACNDNALVVSAMCVAYLEGIRYSGSKVHHTTH